MKILSRSVTERLGWTTGSYAVAQAFRLVNNVVLARLLAPELFGIMLIVNTLRTGVELLSDIGIGQNIISNKNGEDPDFYNTAWILQIARGVLLAVVCIAFTYPISQFYNSQTIYKIVPVISSIFIFTGFQSVSRFIAQKRLNLKAVSIYDIFVAVSTMIIHIICAIVTPTIWALVYGGIISSAVAMAGSFFIVGGVKHRFTFSIPYAKEIMHFGKWILLSTIVYFLSMNFDRLYLARSLPFQILGIYSVARSLADVISLLMARIGSLIIFPMVAAAGHSEGALREKLSRGRTTMLLGGAVLVSLFVAASDLVVFLLYDDRYRTAALMLPVLAFGVWFSILCTLSESVLLGVGRPSYGALANLVKLVWLAVGLPVGVVYFGVAGAIGVMAASDLVKYVPLLAAQQREHISFIRQDVLITLAMCAMIVFWRILLWSLGLSGGLMSLWGLDQL
ncbi:MAG: oligosaccharide flippase family protein [Sphingomonadales bacterium]|nr:oligosaccharide flippase family protein [Sphingomonadales bacterium]